MAQKNQGQKLGSTTNYHNKIYADRPEVLTIICPHCGNKYIHKFRQTKNDYLWYKELEQVKCPKCHRERI